MTRPFGDVFRGKTVLVTGNTGFKGSWLTTWLLRLGAVVAGAAIDVPTQPAMFEALSLRDRVAHHVLDLRDLPAVRALFDATRPDYVFHLAAQSVVSRSYRNPTDTITTNVVGTTNVLEALRLLDRECVAVIITSDKCYDNVEWLWGYRETDPLGGRDIYSGSKAAAEMVIRSYAQSFLMTPDHPIRIGVGRAGNVIGGGDWAPDAIVPDAMRAWSQGEPVRIRSPRATRPWQHVLEPLSGYLTLAQRLTEDRTWHGEAFNFGPRAEQNQTVAQLLCDLATSWGSDPGDAYVVTGEIPFHEAGLLKLNIDKALFGLHWAPTWTYADAIRHVAAWYHEYYRGAGDVVSLTGSQIEAYEAAARAQAVPWAMA